MTAVTELARFLEELAPLLPARVQKVSVYAGGHVVVELFPGRKVQLHVDVGTPGGRCLLEEPQLTHEGAPPREQGLLRKELVPARLAGAALFVERATLRLSFERPDGGLRALVVELDARETRAVLTGSYPSGERVLSVIGPLATVDGRDLRRGREYEAPRAPAALDDEGAAAGASDGAAARARTRPDPQLQELRARLKSEAKRVARLCAALERDLEKHGDPDELARDGELLKTVVARVPKGAGVVDVTDWEGTPRRVALDPARSAAENLERLFRRAKKAREGRARIAPRLEDARAKLAALDEARAELLAAEPPAGALERAAALLVDERAAPSARRQAAKEGPRRPWRAFVISRDVVARVGRSAKDNDELTFHVAKGNDVWLHARGAPGSHVVVPCERDKELPPDVLLDAAHLAAWFSPEREAERVDVQHARCKHLKKPGKGAPAGLVLVQREKVLHVRIERERIERILAREVRD